MLGPRFLVAEVAEVAALTKTWTRDPAGAVTDINDDPFIAVGTLANGATATFQASRTAAAHSLTSLVEIDGTMGSLSWGMERLNELTIREPGNGARVLPVLQRATPTMASFYPAASRAHTQSAGTTASRTRPTTFWHSPAARRPNPLPPPSRTATAPPRSSTRSKPQPSPASGRRSNFGHDTTGGCSRGYCLSEWFTVSGSGAAGIVGSRFRGHASLGKVLCVSGFWQAARGYRVPLRRSEACGWMSSKGAVLVVMGVVRDVARCRGSARRGVGGCRRCARPLSSWRGTGHTPPVGRRGWSPARGSRRGRRRRRCDPLRSRRRCSRHSRAGRCTGRVVGLARGASWGLRVDPTGRGVCSRAGGCAELALPAAAYDAVSHGDSPPSSRWACNRGSAKQQRSLHRNASRFDHIDRKNALAAPRWSGDGSFSWCPSKVVAEAGSGGRSAACAPRRHPAGSSTASRRARCEVSSGRGIRFVGGVCG
jgi:hypothetical protein